MRQTTAEIERPAPRIERLRSSTAAVGHPAFLSRPIAQDVLLAGLLTTTSLVGVLVHLHVDLPEGGEEATIRSLDALGLLLILLQTVPLIWRRRAPIQVLAVTMSALFAYSVLGYFTSFAALGFLVALYTAAAYCSFTGRPVCPPVRGRLCVLRPGGGSPPAGLRRPFC